MFRWVSEQGVQLKFWSSAFRWVSEQGVHLKFWGSAFRWVSKQGVHLKFWGCAFRWVIGTGYSIEVSGLSVQMVQLIFWPEFSDVSEANWVTLFVLGFWVNAFGEANIGLR